MEMKSLTCPNCGALVDVSLKQLKAHCDYCGYDFIIESSNAYTQGYQYEKGRKDAMEEGAPQELLDEVEKTIRLIQERDDLMLKKRILYPSMMEKKNELSSLTSISGKLSQFALPSAGLAISLLFNYSASGSISSVSSTFEYLFILIFELVILLILFISSHFMYINKKQKSECSYLSTKDDLAEVEEKLKEVTICLSSSPVPKKYQSSDQLDSLNHFLITGQASSVPSAIGMYEEMKRRQKRDESEKLRFREQERMIQNQAEILEELRQNQKSRKDQDREDLVKVGAMVAGAVISSMIFKHKK